MAPISIQQMASGIVARAVKEYDVLSRVGVSIILGASFISLISLILVFLLVIPRSKHFKSFSRTNVWAYFISLLLANLIQSAGSVMSLRWVISNSTASGVYCTIQAILKQAGNVATAIWSFMIALHLFNLLFLRTRATKLGMFGTLIIGWAGSAVVVLVGPLVIQDKRGAYFGLSGFWCWITNGYPTQQFYLEYFIEFVSAGLGFLIYSLVLLRVRGNLVCHGGKWAVRWVSRANSWQLSIGRDLLDTQMLRVCVHMVWYPVTYTIVIVPIAVARLSEFSGKPVPAWVTIATDVLFVLNGFINVILLLATRRRFPDPDEMPDLSYHRKAGSINDEIIPNGVTPFTLTRSDTPSLYSTHSLSRNPSIDSTLSTPERALLPSLRSEPSSRFSMDTTVPVGNNKGFAPFRR